MSSHPTETIYQLSPARNYLLPPPCARGPAPQAPPTKSMLLRRVLLGVYLALDIALPIVFLGVYHSDWSFSVDELRTQLLSPFTSSYHFTTHPVDFVGLALLRTTCIIAGVVLVLARKQSFVNACFMPALGVSLVCYAYGLVKLLAISEHQTQLYFPGFWLELIWCMLSAVSFVSVWFFILSGHLLSDGYQRLVASRDAITRSRTESSDGAAPADSPPASAEKSASTGQHIVRLLSYCKHQWRWFSIGFVFLMFYSVARIFIPDFIGETIDSAVIKSDLTKLGESVMKVAGFSLIATVFGGLRGGTFDYATALVSRQVRLDLFRSLAQQDIAFFDVTKSGEIVSRLTSDCQTISSTVSTNLNVFMRNGTMLIGALGFMFFYSWRLSCVTFIAIPLIAFITKWYGTYYDRLSESTQTTIAKANQMAEEVLSTMRTVRSFACEKREVDRFESHLNNTLGVNKKRSIAYAGYTWTNELCENCILVGVVFYGGYLVINNRMEKEDLIKFLLYQMQLGENLYNIGYVMTGLMESVGASRKVFEYMNREPAIPMDGVEHPAVNGKIEFRNVHFTYPSRPKNPVIKGLHLTVAAGETLALVGPSGGGKSSIVALLQHFYEPTQGEITLDGVPIRNIDHLFYHQKVSLVAQEPVLYDGSIRSNILYGCDWATEEDMLNAARTANVHSFVSELDAGYDTNCGEKGVQMSGGQKQRIAIARALVRRPAVLILDEATSALDAESEHLVQEALNRCARERTVIIIAHRLSTIEKADRIAVIYKGQVAQIGAHSELMADEAGIYRNLVQKQLRSAEEDTKEGGGGEVEIPK